MSWGAGVIGTRITPLLAARSDKGSELLHHNPDAKLILSSGQGPGEDIAVSEAMARYAEQKDVVLEKIIVVTTAYHVFRALLLAKQQRLKCVGFGVKTKRYFTLNALIREFVGYLNLTWKQRILI